MTPSFKAETIADIAVAVEWILGFRPEESLVVVGLGADGCPTARIDIPRTDAEHQEVARVFADTYVRHPGRVVVLAYTVDEQAAAAALDTVAAALAGACTLFGLHHVNGETVVSRFTGRVDVITPRRRAIIGEQFANADRQRPHEVRADLIKHLTSGTELPVETVAHAIEDAAGDDESDEDRQARIVGVFEQFRADRTPLGDVDAARVLAALSSSKANRDAALVQLERGDQAQVDLLTDLVRRAPAMLRTEPAVLLAMACWLRGNGAAAWVALDQADRGDGHTLYDLMVRVLTEAIHPDAWADFKIRLQDLDKPT